MNLSSNQIIYASACFCLLLQNIHIPNILYLSHVENRNITHHNTSDTTPHHTTPHHTTHHAIHHTTQHNTTHHTTHHTIHHTTQHITQQKTPHNTTDHIMHHTTRHTKHYIFISLAHQRRCLLTEANGLVLYYHVNLQISLQSIFSSVCLMRYADMS